jgi:hypothetical protein
MPILKIKIKMGKKDMSHKGRDRTGRNSEGGTLKRQRYTETHTVKLHKKNK